MKLKEYNISYFSVGAAFPSKTKKDTNKLTDKIVKIFIKLRIFRCA
jgi:thiamine monophosphate synthase